MQPEFNLTYFIIFSLICYFTAFFISKYSQNFFSGSLLDEDFSKPQAFHTEATARIGGFIILSLFISFIVFYFFKFEIFLNDYFTITFLFFFLGFLDDIKIKISPNIRLLIMLVALLTCINFYSIQILKSGIEFLDIFLENSMFQTCFVLLCFLFIINGANLVDGFNGLLAIHFLLITSIFTMINLTNQNQNISIILITQMIIVFSFLLFNFPRAKIFLGDGGSYLLGSLVALNSIKTYELNPQLSPFLFACILFYLFYEVFFSFFRKSIKKKSPLNPDNFHLHMLLYSFLKNFRKIKNSNFITSLIINTTYLILVTPVVFFQENGFVLKYYFLLLLFFYSLTYLILKKIKN
jgi:UDP-GlcNAc:undecaprenyl-phosphate GlcNAc-1-phosphate transferase